MGQTRLVEEKVLKKIKGELDKKDSLLTINEFVIHKQQTIIFDLEKKVDGLNEEIAVRLENCKASNILVSSENNGLKEENKELKKKVRKLKTIIVAVPTIIVGTAVYLFVR